MELIERLRFERPSTYFHSIRVAKEIDEYLKFYSIENKDYIVKCAVFHDIGKLLVPTSILYKNSKLNKEEFEIVKRHAEDGYQILLKDGWPDKMAEIVRYHHERVDGKGYHRIKVFPDESKLLTLSDSYDAMKGRIYQAKKTKKEIIDEINSCSGSQFDPRIAEKFIKFINCSIT